jgi:signal transduction histidine kinase
MTVASIAMSLGLTAAMSLVFYRAIRIEMMVTGLVCAIVIDRVVARITGHYRRELTEANRLLEARVRERTAELERARDELLAKDRLATAGTLAAAVSHEIRSPLNVITMATEELSDQLDSATPPAQRELVQDVGDAAERIAVILRDLSSLARPVDDPLAPTALAPVIASAARLARYRLGKGAQLVIEDIDVPPVIGNAARLVQIVLNLVINAARATRKDTPNVIRVRARAAGDTVVLAVADTGAGMSPETRARLFEPFFTTGRATGGTGLGLAICHMLLQRMGGAIDVASTLGEGTTVEVTLRQTLDADPRPGGVRE